MSMDCPKSIRQCLQWQAVHLVHTPHMLSSMGIPEQPPWQLPYGGGICKRFTDMVVVKRFMLGEVSRFC